MIDLRLDPQANTGALTPDIWLRSAEKTALQLEDFLMIGSCP